MKILIPVLLLSTSSLFAANQALAYKQKSALMQPDKIDRLVNDFLADKTTFSQVSNATTNTIHQSSGNYYIQMSAYHTGKPISMIKQIVKKGYKVQTKRVNRDNEDINLLLVGPFSSRDQIARYMPDLKQISYGAFVYTAK